MVSETGVDLNGDQVESVVIRHGQLRPGDLLVLSYPGQLLTSTATRLAGQLSEEIGHGVQVLILDNGMSVHAIIARPDHDN